MFFDKDMDGRLDFKEFVTGLDIVERGTFDQKCRYCFDVYDIYSMAELDIVTLRSLFKRVYAQPILKMEEALAKVDSWPKQNALPGWTWGDFEGVILPLLKECMPVMLDKMDFQRAFVTELEVRYGFTLESLEELWNMMKQRTLKPVSTE